ncbi:hypothetical protein EVA_02873 [gut metagenome]|uniref:Uncharacterized protein n=1 Tax=gut metagenome TaxID=749906 RepID=J9D881_9ZZZZ
MEIILIFGFSIGNYSFWGGYWNDSFLNFFIEICSEG